MSNVHKIIQAKEAELTTLKKVLQEKKQPREAKAIFSIVFVTIIIMMLTTAIHYFIILPLGLITSGIILWIILILQTIISIMICILTHKSHKYKKLMGKKEIPKVEFKIQLLEKEIADLKQEITNIPESR